MSPSDSDRFRQFGPLLSRCNQDVCGVAPRLGLSFQMPVSCFCRFGLSYQMPVSCLYLVVSNVRFLFPAIWPVLSHARFLCLAMWLVISNSRSQFLAIRLVLSNARFLFLSIWLVVSNARFQFLAFWLVLANARFLFLAIWLVLSNDRAQFLSIWRALSNVKFSQFLASLSYQMPVSFFWRCGLSSVMKCPFPVSGDLACPLCVEFAVLSACLFVFMCLVGANAALQAFMDLHDSEAAQHGHIVAAQNVIDQAAATAFCFGVRGCIGRKQGLQKSHAVAPHLVEFKKMTKTPISKVLPVAFTKWAGLQNKIQRKGQKLRWLCQRQWQKVLWQLPTAKVAARRTEHLLHRRPHEASRSLSA